MAVGATGDYWRQESLPGVHKHAFIRRYFPVFGGKTGSRAGSVVFLDGYAGRGRHDDGLPGSAELIMQAAEAQASKGISWDCRFIEKDAESYRSLAGIVAEYSARGVAASAVNARVEDELPDVLDAATSNPLFLFLDPTGLGVPYQTLVGALAQRSSRWPPTEVLMNFSMDAVRRIGGHLGSPHANDSTLDRLDEALGGSWWRGFFDSGRADAEAVVDQFVTRLGSDTGFRVFAVPVRRAPSHKPIYYLVFATRNVHGVWAFSDAAAKAADDWRSAYAASQNSEGTLFDVQPEVTLDDLESQAIPDIATNIEALLQVHERFQVRDYPEEILGRHLGQVRTAAVRQAVKLLFRQGKTACNGVGGRSAEELVITRP